MSMKKTALLLAASILINCLTGYIATTIIPYHEQLSFPEIFRGSTLPTYIKHWAMFDGLHYIKIATEGAYEGSSAFFPLYPLLIGLLSSVMSPFLAGIGISLFSLAGTLYLFPRYLKALGLSEKAIWWAVLLFLAFPTAFYLQAVYTESLFIFLLVASLYFSAIKRPLYAALFGYAAGLTRIVGIFLCIPLALGMGMRYLSEKKCAWLVVASPILGMLTYMAFLWSTTGDPLQFFHILPLFRASRDTHLILFPQVIYRYIKIFITADFTFQYVIAVVEFASFCLAGVVLTADLWRLIKRPITARRARLGLNLFSIASILIATTTGTLLSIPRLILPLFSFFIFLGEYKNEAIKVILLMTFLTLHVILLLFFFQGYFVS